MTNEPSPQTAVRTLFLCGDVMTGRGVDQILPHPGSPQLFEPCVQLAQDYVALAERVNGPIGRGVDFGYVWGDALAEFDAVRPDVRIVNLETAITTAKDHWPGKGVHYRMHPANVGALTAARIDCCALANNHVLDWGYAGLQETLMTLHGAGIRTAGAGRDAAEAAAPAAITLPNGGRALVMAVAVESSGVPAEWAAGAKQPGVFVVTKPSVDTASRIGAHVRAAKRAGDLVVLSIHWGPNWGYAIPPAHRTFARQLIDRGEVDLIHGHSSHHPLGMELYRGKLILYGCGDFLNDYEGIRGYEAYRGDLTFMYFATLDPVSGDLLALTLKPMQIRTLRLNHASGSDAAWLERTLSRAWADSGLSLERRPGNTLVFRPR